MTKKQAQRIAAELSYIVHNENLYNSLTDCRYVSPRVEKILGDWNVTLVAHGIGSGVRYTEVHNFLKNGYGSKIASMIPAV